MEGYRFESERLRALEGMTIESLKKSIGNYPNLLEALGGELSIVPGESVQYIIPSWEMEGENGEEVAEIGPLIVTLNLKSYAVKVYGEDGANLSEGGHCHPHVSRAGNVCWGQSLSTFTRTVDQIDPFGILFMVVNFLRTGYHEDDAYESIAQWDHGPEGWYCDHCDEHHPDDESCPEWCDDCETHVNGGVAWHAWCHEHLECYERYGDDRLSEHPVECPLCVEEEERAAAAAAAAAAEEEERAAAAAAAEEEERRLEENDDEDDDEDEAVNDAAE
jgi:hypothetical protein